MAETYCGKTCAECSSREEMNCPGCKLEPGRPITGDCPLARCCREKGHETCSTCSACGHCNTHYNRYQMPQRRQWEQQLAQQRVEAVNQRAPILGKWLMILFWLVIVGNVVSLLAVEDLAAEMPGMYLAGILLQCACNCAYGLILLRFRDFDDGFRTAGVCALIASLAGLLAALIWGSATQGWGLLLTLPASLVSLLGQQREYHAYAAVLTDVDEDLKERWPRLWKWNIGMMVAVLASTLFLLISPVLWLIMTLITTVATVVVAIMKIVRLYQTAQVFRAWTASIQ